MSLPPLKLPSPLARPLRTGLLLTLTLWAVHSMERLGAQDRLHGENLLLTRQPDGTVAAAKTPEHWEGRREEIARGFSSIVGNLPGEEKRCPLEVQVEEEVDCGSYQRRRISYQSEPGCRVPAYLCIPKRLLEGTSEERTASAVLCLHSTDDRAGYGLVVGLSDQPNLAYASELAERGLVTIAPSYPLLANYQPDLAALGWESGTLKAVWDNQRAIDLLASLPYVRPGPVGAIGHSLGGHNAVFTAFLDQRVGVVVSSCGLDSFLDYYGGNERVWMPEKGWTQTRYMPRLAQYRGRLEQIPFDFPELVAGLAPRPVLLIAPQRDENFRAASVDRIAAAARPVFELSGKPERLRVLHPECGHDFPREMREAAYEWIEQAFRER
ncbi:MAG: alpha/beta hydrolase family protein [Planctomycetota bacterium]|jgi:dienelactone hydrolase